MKEQIRLNKYLANLGIESRRGADKLIQEKKIKVNGLIATPGTRVSEADDIYINGKPLKREKETKVYFILNKPRGVVSSVKDPFNLKTVVSIIDTDKRIFPIGRLDTDTTGLIILTNDGDLFNRVIHPRSKLYKSYIVKVKGDLNKEKLENLKQGVMIDSGLTLPAKVKLLSGGDKNIHSIELSIREGKNRQIRKMCKALKLQVLDLKRTHVGMVSLGDLKVGEYRQLTNEELKYLKSL